MTIHSRPILPLFLGSESGMPSESLWLLRGFFFKAWRSPASNTQTMLHCEVPRRTAAKFPKFINRKFPGCDALPTWQQRPQKKLIEFVKK